MNFRTLLYTLMLVVAFSCDSEEDQILAVENTPTAIELRSEPSQKLLDSLVGTELLTGITFSELSEVDRDYFKDENGVTKTYVSFSTGVNSNNEKDIVSAIFIGSSPEAVARFKHNLTEDIIYFMYGKYGEAPAIAIDSTGGLTVVSTSQISINTILCIINNAELMLDIHCPNWPLGWYGDSWTPCALGGTTRAVVDAVQICT